MYDIIAIITRDELVGSLLTAISIFAALVLAYLGERRIRRRKTGEDFAYGMHLLRSLKLLQGERGDVKGISWKDLAKRATEQINKATVDGNYKVEDKAHAEQLREVCYLLKEHGALKQYDASLPPKLEGRRFRPLVLSYCREAVEAFRNFIRKDEHKWVEGHSWSISDLGKKVLHRTQQRESHDERSAVFELWYRSGSLPPPIQGEEHGQHHKEYLEHLLEARDGEGDYIVRADDKEATGLLMRVDVKTEEHISTEFRYVEFSQTNADKEPEIESSDNEIRIKMDRVWPMEGLTQSRLMATKIIKDEIEKPKLEELYDIPVLHHRAWRIIAEDIVNSWPGLPYTLIKNSKLAPLNKLLDEAEEELSEDLGKLHDYWNHPRPIEAINRMQKEIDEIDINGGSTMEKIEALRNFMEKESVPKFKLPKSANAIAEKDLTLEAWVAMIPKRVGNEASEFR